jgi:hypothetical protein
MSSGENDLLTATRNRFMQSSIIAVNLNTKVNINSV